MFDAVGAGALLMLLALYLSGLWTLQRRNGRLADVRRRQLIYFLCGWVSLAVALISPLDALSDVLFSAHMLQHLFLLLLAPLFFVLSKPLPIYLWALPQPTRRLAAFTLQPSWVRNGWHKLTAPVMVWFTYTALLWFWHAPSIYQAALRTEWLHVLEHLSFFGAAALLWWAVIHPRGGARRYGIGMLILFLTALQGSVLGALLTFSSVLWYPIYAPWAAYSNRTPLADQQLAGLIMWIPPGIFYLSAILALFALWLGAVEKRTVQREVMRYE